MRRMFAAATALLATLPLRVAGAQSPVCTAQAPALRDACQKGADMFALLAPQVNGALAAGGPVLGSARSSNGISIGLRVNAVDGRVPDLTSVRLGITGATASTFGTKRAPIPAPTLDLALGIFPGVFVGVQRILAVDALVNVAYIPNRAIDDFSVRTTNGSLKLGYGARVGLLADRFLVPAVAVSYFRRSLPTASFTTTFSSGVSGVTTPDTLELGNLNVQNDALRLSLSKKLGFLELGGGVGQDRYTTAMQLRARVSVSSTAGVPPVSGGATFQQILKRNVAYGSAALNVFRLRLAAEAGSTFGGDSVQTFNTFTNSKINEQRLFGSVGVRVLF
jgi:hypothetical protein